MDTIETYERRQKKELKKKIVDICDLGYVVTQNINSLFSENPKTIMPWDVYPELFSEEKRISVAHEQEMEFERFKSRRREYAAAHNARR